MENSDSSSRSRHDPGRPLAPSGSVTERSGLAHTIGSPRAAQVRRAAASASSGAPVRITSAGEIPDGGSCGGDSLPHCTHLSPGSFSTPLRCVEACIRGAVSPRSGWRASRRGASESPAGRQSLRWRRRRGASRGRRGSAGPTPARSSQCGEGEGAREEERERARARVGGSLAPGTAHPTQSKACAALCATRGALGPALRRAHKFSQLRGVKAQRGQLRQGVGTPPRGVGEDGHLHSCGGEPVVAVHRSRKRFGAVVQDAELVEEDRVIPIRYRREAGDDGDLSVPR